MIVRKVNSKFMQYLRVWKLLKKPTYSEFMTISKVSFIGLLVIGALGFIISVSMKMMF